MDLCLICFVLACCILGFVMAENVQSSLQIIQFLSHADELSCTQGLNSDSDVALDFGRSIVLIPTNILPPSTCHFFGHFRF